MSLECPATSELSLPCHTLHKSLQLDVHCTPIVLPVPSEPDEVWLGHRPKVGSPMRWARRKRFAGWLALAALALQLVLTFGHVHIDSIHRTSPAVDVAGSGTQVSQSVPAQQPSNDADDYCAVCATIYLAANSFIPQAPQLPALFKSRLIEHFDRVAVDFIAPRRTLFQPRAPPQA